MGRDVAPDGFDPDRLFAQVRRVQPIAVEHSAPPTRGIDWPLSDDAAWLALKMVTGRSKLV